MVWESLGIASAIGAGITSLVGYEIAEDQEWKGIQSTTILGVSASLTSAIALSQSEKNEEMTARYIDSLSDEQLIEMEQRLSAKEEEFNSLYSELLPDQEIQEKVKMI